MTSVKEHLLRNEEDIRRILSFVLSKTTAELYASGDYELSTSEERLLEDLVSKRSNGYPFAYIAKTQGFYEHEFIVSEDVLIPRPETELIIEIVKAKFADKNNFKVLDMGTGSGIIAISLKSIFKDWSITATDISEKALNVARQNIEKILSCKDIDLYLSDWFNELSHQKYDLIISNPPYIAEGDKHLNDLEYEPISALTSGKEGMDSINNIINNAPKFLEKGGFLLLEHGYDQANAVRNLLERDFHNIKKYKDLSGNDRATIAQVRIF